MISEIKERKSQKSNCTEETKQNSCRDNNGLTTVYT